MAMKYFVVRQSSNSEIIFVISFEQEARFLASVSGARPPVTIVSSNTVTAENLASELNDKLRKNTILVLSSPVLAMKHPQIAMLACEAHLRGVRMIGFEAALSELNVQVGTESDQLVKTFMHSGVKQTALVRMYASVKYTFEPLLALLMLIALSPVFAVVALLVRVTSAGPVFYRQTRVGYRGKHFEIVKFRSMRVDAEKDGPVWASAKTGDSRLSPIGAFLRASHLDELPQLWNVARGELSFVGPRPERPVFTDKLVKDIPLFNLRTLVKPGITGWAQVCQGYANSVDDSRVKLELDFYYILKHSPMIDVQVVLRTLGVMTSGGTEGKKRKRLKTFARVAEAAVPGRGTLPVGVLVDRRATRPQRQDSAGTPIMITPLRRREDRADSAMRAEF